MLAYHKTIWLNNVVFLLWVMVILQVEAANDAEILLKFKQSLLNTDALSTWETSNVQPCTNNTRNWVGVICNRGSLFGLQLENMKLKGTIDIDTLAQLSTLRTISVMNNSLDGPFPAINKLGRLRSVFFSYNNFSGEIHDDAFEHMAVLKKVHLANNSFTGNVPKSLANLAMLLEVTLENNQFYGHVPNFKSSELKVFNISNNYFDGQVPPFLAHMNTSTYLGNPGLCGSPLPACKPSIHKNSLSMVLIIVITVALLLFMTGVFIVLTKYRGTNTGKQITARDVEMLPHEKAKLKQGGNDLYPNNQARALERPTSYKKSDNGKLCFLRNDRQKFEMQDLLKASAEVLGSGSFGSSYKAAIIGGPTFVVKRFRQMNNVGKEEFQELIKKLGRLRHPNLLPLVAFFHKRDEKLIISDFVENGSLASHLHGKRTPDQPGLRWSTRLKIIKGVARGLAYLYRELAELALPHGHLKSSNVLLDDKFEPLLSDYAFTPLINKEHGEQVMAAYKSPEFTQNNTITKKTDVWCLGILILEILTGKFPANYLKHGKGGNDELATWVDSVIKEEWSSEMFDMEMRASRSCKGEMLKLLKIGMWCCEWNEEKRWSLRDAVEKIEELKEMDNDDLADFPSGRSFSSESSYSRIASITTEEVV
ncbi:pollen receptor-like kinase 4 [Chenopodium quinoa]|uniref:Protein kinase domain-containing protein n=1 Tax=Chenopodium quinoa TaxID=63459 RepID=A0A803NCK5_CHEQI|nr:pollen receptor-like kinase 4 [Chenopodium quinoa]